MVPGAGANAPFHQEPAGLVHQTYAGLNHTLPSAMQGLKIELPLNG
jgi:hypothetical protein